MGEKKPDSLVRLQQVALGATEGTGLTSQGRQRHGGLRQLVIGGWALLDGLMPAEDAGKLE